MQTLTSTIQAVKTLTNQETKIPTNQGLVQIQIQVLIRQILIQAVEAIQVDIMVAKAPTDINFASTTYPLAYLYMQGGIRIQKTWSLTM